MIEREHTRSPKQENLRAGEFFKSVLFPLSKSDLNLLDNCWSPSLR